MSKRRKPKVPLAETALRRHFGKVRLESLVTASRVFPVTARVDLQLALEKLFEPDSGAKLMGIHRHFGHDTLTIAGLIASHHDPVVIGPMQHEEVDIGETMPARCLRQGLWLSRAHKTPLALLLSSAVRFGQLEGSHIEIAVPAGEAGAALSRRILEQLEMFVRQTASFRGKVISLETPDRFSGGRNPLERRGGCAWHRQSAVAGECNLVPGAARA